jgi:hypothetical protein
LNKLDEKKMLSVIEEHKTPYQCKISNDFLIWSSQSDDYAEYGFLGFNTVQFGETLKMEAIYSSEDSAFLQLHSVTT